MQPQHNAIRRLLLINKFVASVGAAIEYGRWEWTYRKYRERYAVHPTFVFNGPGILLYGDGKIELEEDSYIGRFSSIESGSRCEVRIGKRCAISPYVMVYTSSRLTNTDFSKSKHSITGDVGIEDDCWIGAHVFINPNISVGNNSVLGANAVVTKNIPLTA